MKQIIGGLLIIAALAIGYDGVHKLQGSGASVKILGMEINAEDTGAKQTAYTEIVLAVLVLASGLYLLRSSKNN